MNSSELYGFLISCCKKNRVKIEDLVRNTGYSRSSVYRYMKGISPMHPQMRDALIELLQMNPDEKNTFLRLLEHAVTDPSLLQARRLLDQFVFGSESAEHAEIPLIFYDGEQYYRDMADIRTAILNHAEQPGFFCEIKIVNCLQHSVLNQISMLLQQLAQVHAASRTEHLMSLHSGDHAGNIETFIHLVTTLPLHSYKHYEAYYNDRHTNAGAVAIFEDSILIRCSFEHDGRLLEECYWLSFSRESLSACIRFEDRYLYAFLSGSYNDLRHRCDKTLCKSSGINYYSESLIELAHNTDSCLVKPSNCYDKMPIAVYESIFQRCKDQLGALIRQLWNIEASAEQAIAYFIRHMKNRIDLTKQNRCIDVYSMQGLRSLVETGRLTDHLHGMPAFNHDEVRMMLEYIRDRNADPDDPYTLYITQQEVFAASGLVLIIYEKNAIIVEYSRQLQAGIQNNILVESPELIRICVDYIKHHIPENHALDPEQTTAYLNSLLALLA